MCREAVQALRQQLRSVPGWDDYGDERTFALARPEARRGHGWAANVAIVGFWTLSADRGGRRWGGDCCGPRPFEPRRKMRKNLWDVYNLLGGQTPFDCLLGD